MSFRLHGVRSPDIRYATAQRYFHDTKLQEITLNHMSTGLERFLKSVPMPGVKTLVCLRYDEARVLTCLPRYGQRFNGFIMLKKLLVWSNLCKSHYPVSMEF